MAASKASCAQISRDQKIRLALCWFALYWFHWPFCG
jgi:hypothetical protein